MRSQHAEVEPSQSATTEQTEQAEKSDQAIPRKWIRVLAWTKRRLARRLQEPKRTMRRYPLTRRRPTPDRYGFDPDDQVKGRVCVT